MKGIVFAGDSKIEYLDFPDPTPGPDEVVLEIKEFKVIKVWSVYKDHRMGHRELKAAQEHKVIKEYRVVKVPKGYKEIEEILGFKDSKELEVFKE